MGAGSDAGRWEDGEGTRRGAGREERHRHAPFCQLNTQAPIFSQFNGIIWAISSCVPVLGPHLSMAPYGRVYGLYRCGHIYIYIHMDMIWGQVQQSVSGLASNMASHHLTRVVVRGTGTQTGNGEIGGVEVCSQDMGVVHEG